MVRLRSNFNTTPRRTAARRGTANCELSESEVVTRDGNEGVRVSDSRSSLVAHEGRGPGDMGGMIIFVKYVNRRTIALIVEPSDTIENVKAKIQKKLGILPHLQRLVYSAKLLKDDQTLSEYDVEENSTLHVCLRSGSGANNDKGASANSLVTPLGGVLEDKEMQIFVRDELYKNRSSRKIDSRRLFLRE